MSAATASEEIVAPVLMGIEQGEFRAYPVSTNGMITINVPAVQGKQIVLELYALSGKLLQQKKLPSQTPTVEVNLDGLANVVYTIVVKCEKRVLFTTKVLRQ